jgi:tetratricopeptide (TPR) repeat protein
MNIGCTVRARRRIRQSSPFSGDASAQQSEVEITQRAMIATIEKTNACLLWESGIPRPIAFESDSSCRADMTSSEAAMTNVVVPFMITPNRHYAEADAVHDNVDTEQSTESLLPLLEFENTIPSKVTNIRQWKEFGDALYQLHDVVAAIPYYEYALYLSTRQATNGRHQYNVGATILMKDVKGFILAAEIDCVDNTDTGAVFDITMIKSGEERSIRQTDILINILHPHMDCIQIRLLLNLTRCLIQLGDITDFVTSNTSTNRIETGKDDMQFQYRDSAVLASSLSLAIIQFLHARDNDDNEIRSNLTKLETSALLLRSKVQLQLQKVKHATCDVQRILRQNPNHNEGKQLLHQIKVYEKQAMKRNQRLAKNMSSWIQKTLQMDGNTIDDGITVDDNIQNIEVRQSNIGNAPVSPSLSTEVKTALNFYSSIIFLIIIAFMMQQRHAQ